MRPLLVMMPMKQGTKRLLIGIIKKTSQNTSQLISLNNHCTGVTKENNHITSERSFVYGNNFNLDINFHIELLSGCGLNFYKQWFCMSNDSFVNIDVQCMIFEIYCHNASTMCNLNEPSIFSRTLSVYLHSLRTILLLFCLTLRHLVSFLLICN